MPWFWPRLVVHGLTWLALVLQLPLAVVPWALFLAAIYLAGYFVSQLSGLGGGRYKVAASYLCVVASLASLIVLGPHVSALSLFLAALLLVSPPLIDTTVTAVETRQLGASLGFLLLTVATLTIALVRQGVGAPELVAVLLTALLLPTAVVQYRRVEAERRQSRERYSALLSEYRDLKRSAASSADAARAEERMNVARRLHDSVGHKLTSLLMQIETNRLEAERLGSDASASRRAEELKRLAQESLDETRAAVVALSEDELMGMPALLRLINNLEVESAMRVEFTLGSGALNVDLEQAPAIALYRAVQEALTNAMRHGAGRRARVKVEVPGGRLVRFEVENELRTGVTSFEPGFGLTAMRERVEAAGGGLEVRLGAGTFLVRGSFPVAA